jgi:ribosomal protein L34
MPLKTGSEFSKIFGVLDKGSNSVLSESVGKCDLVLSKATKGTKTTQDVWSERSKDIRSPSSASRKKSAGFRNQASTKQTFIRNGRKLTCPPNLI